MSRKKLKLPSGLGDVQASVAEFCPDQTTMERFDREPLVLCDACNAWLEAVQHPPTEPPECDYEFDQLTEALQLWASLHGLGDGEALTNGATLYYSPTARGSGLDLLVRADSFIRLIKNRGSLRRQPNESGVPTLVSVREAAKILQISERTLATLTKRRAVPCVRVGRSVRYNAQTLWEIVKRGQC
jgi:excisionase family DNA binding protein